MLTNRETDILIVLLESNDYITSATLAERFHVSKQTILNDISDIQDEIGEKIIISRKGAGYLFEGTPEMKSKIMREYIPIADTINQLSEEQACILYDLLEENGQYISAERIGRRRNISGSNVRNIIATLNDFLRQFGVQIVSKKRIGYSIKGSERALRKVYAVIFYESSFCSHYQKNAIYDEVLSFTKIDPALIRSEIKKYESLCNVEISENAYFIASIHIAIALKRIKDGQEITNEKIIGSLPPEATIAVKNICEDFESALQIRINSCERYLICLYLSSAQLTYCSLQNIAQTQSKVEEQIAYEIIKLVKNVKEINFNEQNALNDLLVHIKPLLQRARNGISIVNPMLLEVKKKYPEAFGIAYMSNRIFQEYAKVTLSEDELSYLAVHIELIIETSEENAKVILVCENGIGVSRLLQMKLAKEIPSLTVVDVVSSANLANSIKEHPCDFIISTTPLKIDCLVVYISPLLNDADIQAIQKYIRHPEIRLKDPALFFVPHSSCNTQKEIIRSVARELHEQAFVTDQYEQAIWDRENEVSTYVGNNTAIPHAKFDTVKKSSIVVVTTKNLVPWGSGGVDLIMFLSLTKDDAKIITKRLKNIYYMLFDQSFHSRIANATTAAEMSRYFYEVYDHEHFRNC